jgi:outer membrane cobalamin receptor
VGLEQRLLRSRLRLEATFFHHDYRDQIAYTVVDFDTFQGTYVNLGHTRARGLELGLEAAPRTWLSLRAQYTHTDGEILTSPSTFDPLYAEGQALLRRPENQASFAADAQAGRLKAGATVVAVGRRADGDFVGLGLAENAGYTRVDARVRVAVGARLEAFLGRALRLGLRVRAGGSKP